MGGLLLGGILWGVLGDKAWPAVGTFWFDHYVLDRKYRVRLRRACRVHGTDHLLRRDALCGGVGLAGELGAGITLVSEVLSKELRAIGTSLVAGIGLIGAVVACFTVRLFN
jgi:hypothetical protein